MSTGKRVMISFAKVLLSIRQSVELMFNSRRSCDIIKRDAVRADAYFWWGAAHPETGSCQLGSGRGLLEQLFVRTEQAITAFAINNLTAP